MRFTPIHQGVIPPFWHQYAKHYPNVRLVMTEALGCAHIHDRLQRGEIYLGQNLLSAVPTGDTRYANAILKPVDQLATFYPKLAVRKSAAIEIRQRSLPRYANAFCDMLADLMKDTFPVTRPRAVNHVPIMPPRRRPSV